MILSISGSAGHPSSNTQLLKAVAEAFPEYNWNLYDQLPNLPLYQPDMDQSPIPDKVEKFRSLVRQSGAVIISTPEYLHNIPACLKNGLEWLRTNGELHEKPVLPITLTPRSPRGQYAMASLRNSLQALQARIVAEMPLYRNEMQYREGGFSLSAEDKELFSAALEML
ncbi:MAG TPA: NADPH-dependent FMN reductase [Saprospiraceae bacterium]|nr:NADPH-dependent FMN reductase [Saprospiraceae bacterium]